MLHSPSHKRPNWSWWLSQNKTHLLGAYWAQLPACCATIKTTKKRVAVVQLAPHKDCCQGLCTIQIDMFPNMTQILDLAITWPANLKDLWLKGEILVKDDGRVPCHPTFMVVSSRLQRGRVKQGQVLLVSLFVTNEDHHYHHLSRSCHCWQMASTTCAMHFDPGPFSSIDCQRLPRCHLSISFWVFLLVVFHLWVSTLMLFSPTWCSSFWLHVLPTVLSCTSLFLLYLSPLFSILLSRSWSCLSLWCSITISPCSVGLQQASSLDVLLKSMSLLHRS